MNFLYTCVICGRRVDLAAYDPADELYTPMRDRHICCHCAYWDKIAETRPSGSIVVSGELVVPSYVLYDPFVPTLKRKVFIINRQTGEAIKANALVNYGQIPERLRSRMPDEGAYTDYNIYRKVAANAGYICRKPGCLDRYHCFFYHPDISEPDGPWNVVPPGHKPGWEGCPIFINQQQLFNECD